jgi:hypothetical protein
MVTEFYRGTKQTLIAIFKQRQKNPHLGGERILFGDLFEHSDQN